MVHDLLNRPGDNEFKIAAPSFIGLAMTLQVMLILVESWTDTSKIYGHCEDPPVGGDEAIPSDILKSIK
jgi:hypothetical protein